MLAANLGLLLTAIAWGSMIPVLNLLLAHWDPYFLSAVRYSLGAPILLLVLRLSEPGPLWPRGARTWRVLPLGAVGIGLFSTLFTLGIANANPVTAAVIMSAGPVVAALVARVGFRLPIDPGLVPAVTLAVLGAAMATYDPGAAGGPFQLRGGEPLLLLASTCWAWYSLAAQRWLAGWSQIRITGLTMSAGAVVTVAVYLLASLAGAATLPPPAPTSGGQVGLLAWVVLFGVVAGVFLWNNGVRVLGVVFASLFMNLAPVLAILMTAAIGVEPRPLQLAGAAAVLAGVVQAQWRSAAKWRRSRSSIARVED